MRTETVPARTREVVDRTTCDLCEQEIRERCYDVDRTEVYREHGTSYPEGTNLTKRRFDVCGPCFESKLVPWLEAQGATMSETEIEF
jgi:hypothetical protein